MPDWRASDSHYVRKRYEMTQPTEQAYRAIAVSGVDAAEFLQGQLTSDIETLIEGESPMLSAWCNPKGRVIALFRLRLANGAYRLALPAELADAVAKRLTLFRFRSKVDLVSEDALPADLGLTSGESMHAWRRRQFNAGIAEIGEPQSEEFTPHMLNLDLLGAVSFDKGCYTGQEIVARTHYRGATRRRMLRYGFTGSAAAGDKIMLGERPVGDVVNVLDREILAVAPLDDADAGLTLNDTALVRKDLPYL